MRRLRSTTARILLAASIAGAGIGTCAAVAAPAQAATTLQGTLHLTSGACTADGATGTYFRMINPTGNTQGPFLDNGDSPCAKKSYTILSAGSDGGLVLNGYQPEPSPAFDSDGNSLARRLIKPVSFFGVNFSADTSATDPQTKHATTPPTLSVSGSSVTGDLRAFGASWNKQEFNQGAPKPDGSRPGVTTTPHGSFDAKTGAITVEWTSQIVGGPFDKFTGLWHLTGTVSTGAAAPETSATTAAQVSTSTAAPDAATGTTGTTDTTGTTGTTGPSAEPAASATATDEPTPVATDDSVQPSSTPTIASVTKTGSTAPKWVIILVAIIGVVAVVTFVAVDARSRSRAGGADQ